MPPSVDEILRDIAHIGGAEVDVGAAGEEEEEAYVEVFEYLRAGVQLIHDELTLLRADPAGADEVGSPDEPDRFAADADEADDDDFDASVH
jgi:hypothetical protein